MYNSDEHHLQTIIASFESEVALKYRKGAIEHGGHLWEKPGMIENAMEEVLDLYVYLFTLRDQINALKAKYEATEAVDNQAGQDS
ncbi:MAG: hypothetical protein ACLGJB_03740 [Blastocatellia bacterium]